MSDNDILVQMANDIADYFVSVPDPDQAAEQVANHLRMFWAPRMRQKICARLQAEPEQTGLSPLARTAITRLDEYARAA